MATRSRTGLAFHARGSPPGRSWEGLAIIALTCAKRFGLVWADAAIGIVGAIVILHWTWGLLRDSGAALIDWLPEPQGEHPEHHQPRPKEANA